MQQIYQKKNEVFEVEFYKDKECTKPFDFTNTKNLYIEGDIATLMDLFATQEVDTEADIYIPYLTNTWNELCLQDSFSSHVLTLNDITPNLSKYIPEDNAVLFLSEEDKEMYCNALESNICLFSLKDLEIWNFKYLNNSGEMETPQKATIFLYHGTQSELQQANEVAKELKEEYGIEEVNLFVLHWFFKIDSHHFFSDWRYDFLRNIIEDEENAKGIWHGSDFRKFVENKYEERIFLNKIITTNSTGILQPQNTERLQVIDCKEIFEEYINGN